MMTFRSDMTSPLRRAYDALPLAALGIGFDAACRDYLPTLQRTAATQAELMPKLMRMVMRRQRDRVMDDYELTDSQAYLGEMP